MDPTELIKAAPEIAKGLTAIGAAIPFTGIVKRMLGPASDELAEMWRDQIRLYRYGRQIKCLEKAEKMAQDAGFTPHAVPPKILFPLLEGASMEEDETLHDMWAALLANAASQTGKIVRPGFLSLLKEMAPDEAILLKLISERRGLVIEILIRYGIDPEAHLALQANSHSVLTRVLCEDNLRDKESARRKRPSNSTKVAARRDLESTMDARARKAWEEIRTIMAQQWRTFPRLTGESDEARLDRQEVCLEALESAGLLSRRENLIEFWLTARGAAFLAACSPPKPKS